MGFMDDEGEISSIAVGRSVRDPNLAKGATFSELETTRRERSLAARSRVSGKGEEEEVGEGRRTRIPDALERSVATSLNIVREGLPVEGKAHASALGERIHTRVPLSQVRSWIES